MVEVLYPPVPVLPETVLEVIAKQLQEAKTTNFELETNDTLHVVLAIDEAYAPHAASAIASATAFARKPDQLEFHILEDGSLSEETRTNLNKIAQGNLSFVPIKTDVLSHLPLNREYISRATYFRLVMHLALPRRIKKIIYIDADTIVTDSLEKLWLIDLDGHPIAACADEGGLTQSRRLGLPVDHIYFNAGVAVFDLAAMRDTDFEAKVKHAYQANAERITLQDQDILNLIFCNNTKCLPLRWNVNSRLFIGSDLEAAYSADEAHAAVLEPGILHFTDRRKPWMAKNLNPLGHLYWHYRNQTAWRETLAQRAWRCFIGLFRKLLSRSQRSMDTQIKTLRQSR